MFFKIFGASLEDFLSGVLLKLSHDSACNGQDCQSELDLKWSVALFLLDNLDFKVNFCWPTTKTPKQSHHLWSSRRLVSLHSGIFSKKAHFCSLFITLKTPKNNAKLDNYFKDPPGGILMIPWNLIFDRQRSSWKYPNVSRSARAAALLEPYSTTKALQHCRRRRRRCCLVFLSWSTHTVSILAASVWLRRLSGFLKRHQRYCFGVGGVKAAAAALAALLMLVWVCVCRLA